MAAALNFHLRSGIDNYCVVGKPVAHSKSPQIHRLFAKQCQQRIHYQAVLLEPGGFGEALLQFQLQGGKGLNVTVPCKTEAWHAVKHRSERAEIAGAVNTIWFDERGDSQGENTDGVGLVKDLQSHGIALKHKRVLLLGAGGAVRGVLGALLGQGVRSIIIANRTLSRAEALVTNYARDVEIEARGYDGLDTVSVDIIINGTSAGLQGTLPPLSPQLAAGRICYDMVYADTDTAFVRWAKENGAARAIDGLGMLVEQAAEAFFIWRGLRPDTRPVIKSLRNVN